MKARHTTALVTLTAFAILLSGCDKPASEVKSQTVATVAGDTITEAELDIALSQMGTLTAAQAAEAKSGLLQALVDQRLVAQAAKKAGLDKDQEVEIAMAQASRQVLVEAYAQRNFKDVAQPSETEVAAYYAQHPELFSQRRIYRIQELELTTEPSRMAEVEDKLKTSHSIGDFVNWVREQGIVGKSATAVKPAEQIPTPLLARLSQMKDGQVTTFPTLPGQLLILQLLESQLQPVSLEQAKTAIERVMMAQTRKDRMDADLKALRDAAKVEYASGYKPMSETRADTASGDTKPAE